MTMTTALHTKTHNAPSSQRHRRQQQQQQQQQQQPLVGKILVLHGNRQTGDLLLGRMSKLRSTLLRHHRIELVALDAPFLYENDDCSNTHTNNQQDSIDKNTNCTLPPHTINHAGTGSQSTVDDSSNPSANLRTWWHRTDTNTDTGGSLTPSDTGSTTSSTGRNVYHGLSQSIELVRSTWCSPSPSSPPFMGLWGFSQGARLAHLLAMLHHQRHDMGTNQFLLPGLRFVVMVAGYSAPWPDNYRNNNPTKSLSLSHSQPNNMLAIPTLHVWGTLDKLVTPSQSHAVTLEYSAPEIHIHDGGHHVPMRAANVQTYVQFITKYTNTKATTIPTATTHSKPSFEALLPEAPSQTVVEPSTTDDRYAGGNAILPENDVAEQQRDEVQAIQAIFPDEFHLLSSCHVNDAGDDTIYEHPIVYTVRLETDEPTTTHSSWPPHPIRLRITYPPTYPVHDSPILALQHDNNAVEFNSQQSAACLDAMNQAAADVLGSPCILTCLLAAREYLDTPPVKSKDTALHSSRENVPEPVASHAGSGTESDDGDTLMSPLMKTATVDRIRQCNQQGLDIAATLLRKSPVSAPDDTVRDLVVTDVGHDSHSMTGKGGSWAFSIGLVGKPSAGKSTFFNTATAFARQRQAAATATNLSLSREPERTSAIQLGGAAMAPHPFTTIEPNTGFALVPAPQGSCPEDDLGSTTTLTIGSTHGRDDQGRRLLPVLLKDVAGLVPGAYQGRGRGNQFLNDLCDADVLIHVCDASGTADAEGNLIVLEDSHPPESAANGQFASGPSHPLNDMAWIRDELIQWIVTNLLVKWETVRRKGRTKLAAMFSGYGQPEVVTLKVLCAVEAYVNQVENRERSLDHLEDWDVADVHRLVSAFLGVRFPIALALNKQDLPSSARFTRDIQEALPIHGAHVATSLSAQREMSFVRRYMELDLVGQVSTVDEAVPPRGTWDCLQSAIGLCQPVLAFPVLDHTTYAPLPGLIHYATSDPSLPTSGMISGIVAAGGTAPSEWDAGLHQYASMKASVHKKKSSVKDDALRDAILMKPGSTVHDLFLTLKRLGALSGEFVRAEAAGDVGSAVKPIPKHDLITRRTRIIKIMTNKRTAWQNG